MTGSPIIVRATCTPILISDPPLLNVVGVHQPFTPRAVIELETDTGVTGIGETYGDTEYLRIAQVVSDKIIGRPLTAINTLYDLVRDWAQVGSSQHRETDFDGLRGAGSDEKLIRSVFSAYEVASLDALGKVLDLPVHALLGGRVRDRVDYSAYLFYRWAEHPLPQPDGTPADLPLDSWGAALDPEGVVRQAQRFFDQYGFKSFKLKGGVFPPEEEIAAIRALADAFPGCPLRLDPNAGWSVQTSLRVARELDGIIEYLEDPTPTVAEMSEVHRVSGVPLATNMIVTTFAEFPTAVAANAVQVVLSDHLYWGGLNATRELAAICRTYGVTLSMHSNTHLGISLAAMTQVASVIPGLVHACDTHRPWQTEDVITEPHVFVDGALEVTDTPGLGIDLDRQELARLHQRWVDSDIRDRDDVAAMQVAHPDWVRPPIPRF